MTTAVVTIPDSEGESLARDLVENRFAASVNRVDCTSTYRWDDEVRYADEEILLVRTTDDRYDESAAAPDFVEWRRESTSSSDV